MDSELFRKVSEVFEAVHRLAPDERHRYLEHACGSDRELRRHVEEILARHDTMSGPVGDAFLRAGRELREALFEDEPEDRHDTPATIGRYRITGEVARGGIGQVFAAVDDDIGRRIAIKVLRGANAQDSHAVRRLVEEGQIGGQLQHPAIVPIHELGLEGPGAPYLAMKLIEGRTLADLLEERSDVMSERQRFVGIFEQVCQAVAYAHSRGVIHRDLKPANLMVGAFGEVQVMDWGLAKVLSSTGASAPAGSVHTIRDDDREAVSISGRVMGTPAYMSPEQARGEHELVDERADVFGLGAILCEILSGAPPYRGGTTREVLERAVLGDLSEAHARLRSSTADSDVVALAVRCLAAGAGDRPRNAGIVAAEMRRYLESLEERARRAAVTAEAARVRAAGERRARRLTVALALLAVVSVCGGGAAYLWQENERRERAGAAETMVREALAEARELHSRAAPGGDHDVSRWEIADLAAQKALDAATPEVDGKLRREAEVLAADVGERLKDARLVVELESIPLDYGYLETDIGLERDARDDYERAFRDHLGEDVTRLPAEEGATRLRASAYAPEIAVALETWASEERWLAGDESPRWRTLLYLAAQIDPRPWRTSLHEALLAADWEREVLELADSPDVDGFPPATCVLLAKNVVAAGSPETAAALLERASERFPGDFWLHFDLGSRLYDLGRHANALRSFAVALALRPRSTVVLSDLSMVHLALDDAERAARLLRRALEIDPANIRIVYNLARLLQGRGDLAGAEPLYRRALSLAPGTHRAAINLGILLNVDGRPREAIEVLARTLTLDGIEAADLARLHHALGDALSREGRFAESAVRFRESIRLEPRDAKANESLGSVLLRLEDLEGAAAALRAALALEPGRSQARLKLAIAYAGQGRLVAAARELARLVAEAPEDGDVYPPIFRFLQPASAPELDDAVDIVRDALGALLRASSPHHRLAPRAYLQAWCLRPGGESRDAVLELARREARAATRSDPQGLWLLARVSERCGDPRGALLALEEAVRLRETPAVASELSRLRAALAPDLVSCASIDAAVELLPAGVDFEQARGAFEAFRAATGGADAPARVAYLEGRLLERAGRPAGAAAQLRRALAAQKGAWPEPFHRLWNVLLAGEGRDAALESYRQAIDGLELPRRPLPSAPLRPEGRAHGVVTPAVTLVASPFAHLDPRVRHAASRWRLRAGGGRFERDPVLDVVHREDLETLALPAGLLEARTTYLWQVSHIDSEGRGSPFSEEVSLTTGDTRLEAVSLDLSRHFTHDVIANPDDEREDPFDARNGFRLLVTGFDGHRADLPAADGLPLDRRVGVHRLGGYAQANAVQLSRDSLDDVRIDVPDGRYVAVRFLVSGANGDSSVPVRLELEDGSSEDFTLLCDDWFDDVLEGEGASLSLGVTAAWNGMDRLGATFDDRDDPALFEVVHVLERDLELAALVLRPGEAVFSTSSTRFHLFAVTGMRLR